MKYKDCKECGAEFTLHYPRQLYCSKECAEQGKRKVVKRSRAKTYDKIVEYKEKYKKENKEKISNYFREYRQKNRENLNAYRRAYYARKKLEKDKANENHM